jgi:hypothetical protein
MREPELFTTRRRRELERWAAGGCRISAYMLEHGCSFPDALDGLAAGNPRPAVVLDIRDYRDPDPNPNPG